MAGRRAKSTHELRRVVYPTPVAASRLRQPGLFTTENPESHGRKEEQDVACQGLCIFYFREFARSSSVFIFLPLTFCLPVLSVQKEGDRKREAERSLSLVGHSRMYPSRGPECVICRPSRAREEAGSTERFLTGAARTIVSFMAARGIKHAQLLRISFCPTNAVTDGELCNSSTSVTFRVFRGSS